MSPEHGARVSQIQRLIATPPCRSSRASRSTLQIAPDHCTAGADSAATDLARRASRAACAHRALCRAVDESLPTTSNMSVRSVKMQASQSRVTVSEESYSGDANSATAVGDSRVGGPRQGYQRADHVYCRLPRLTALRVSDRVVGGSYHFFCLVAEASAGTAATLVALRPWHDA